MSSKEQSASSLPPLLNLSSPSWTLLAGPSIRFQKDATPGMMRGRAAEVQEVVGGGEAGVGELQKLIQDRSYFQLACFAWLLHPADSRD